MALQLSRLHFHIAYPDNHIEGGWPDSLPRLQILKLLAPSDIPVQFLNYTGLPGLIWHFCTLAFLVFRNDAAQKPESSGLAAIRLSSQTFRLATPVQPRDEFCCSCASAWHDGDCHEPDVVARGKMHSIAFDCQW